MSKSMQNEQSKVFLIILNWNGRKMTLDCLESLVSGIKYPVLSMEIVIVDNGSTDDSVLKIENFNIENSLKIKNFKLKIIKKPKNLGFAEGNNVGIKYALENGADYICLLNNDTRVDPDFLTELINTAESDEKIGIVGGKIYFEKGYEFHKERYKKEDLGKVIWYAGGVIDWKNIYASHRGLDEVDEGQFEAVIDTDYVNGCLLLAKREVFEKIGVFNAGYYMYFEDVDLSLRAKKAGFKLKYCPKSHIWHLIAGSSGIGSGLNDYFTTRNRLLFGMKYAPFRSKGALLKESFRMLKNGRPWQRAGVRDFYLGRFGKGSWK